MIRMKEDEPDNKRLIFSCWLGFLSVLNRQVNINVFEKLIQKNQRCNVNYVCKFR